MREEHLLRIKDRVVGKAAQAAGLLSYYVGGGLWTLRCPRQDETVGYIEYRSDRAFRRWEAGRLPDGTNDPPLVKQFDHVTEAVMLVS